MRKVIWAFGLTAMLIGCRPEDAVQADNQILWDKEGCAFFIQIGGGDDSRVRRATGADKPTCQKPNPYNDQ